MSTEEKAVAKHVRTDRVMNVPLEWPIEFDGKVWDVIAVRRMTAAQLADFLKPGGEAKRFPMFDAPSEVLDALDADDSMKLEEVAKSFLPRRLLAETEDPSPSTSDNGASTSQS